MAELAFRGRGFDVRRLVTGPLDNNVLIVFDTSSREALIVDAADDAPVILESVGDLEVRAIVTTHGHWDHFQAAPAVSTALAIPVYLHPEDAAISDLDAVPLTTGPATLGATSYEVAHTPGHTPGSVCLTFDGVTITGDTLFPGGPGATGFPYGSFDRIIESITDELFTLPDDTVVLPGHGAATTIGTERPQLHDWIDRGW